MKRNQFLQTLAGLSLLTVRNPFNAFSSSNTDDSMPEITSRWRGFNLLEKFNPNNNQPFRESDFAMISDWGFNFVRLPLSYWCWSEPGKWFQMDEQVLNQIDQAVDYGGKYGVHVNLNMHRIPGYCVNPPDEPSSLWEDDAALEGAVYQWKTFAERYKGISSNRLSFDLINEPANVSEKKYSKVIQSLVDAIRAADPERKIIIDGLRYGREPVPTVTDLNVGQSTRGYDPMRVSHYQASWINGSDQWPEPDWPLHLDNGEVWDKQRLYDDILQPFLNLQENQNVFIHVGEWGCFNKTPHDVALAFMEDYLQLWQSVGWGWALWNLRGSFGILDSGRNDVEYEDYNGYQLDRKMLALLQKY